MIDEINELNRGNFDAINRGIKEEKMERELVKVYLVDKTEKGLEYTIEENGGLLRKCSSE